MNTSDRDIDSAVYMTLVYAQTAEAIRAIVAPLAQDAPSDAERVVCFAYITAACAGMAAIDNAYRDTEDLADKLLQISFKTRDAYRARNEVVEAARNAIKTASAVNSSAAQDAQAALNEVLSAADTMPLDPPDKTALLAQWQTFKAQHPQLLHVPHLFRSDNPKGPFYSPESLIDENGISIYSDEDEDTEDADEDDEFSGSYQYPSDISHSISIIHRVMSTPETDEEQAIRRTERDDKIRAEIRAKIHPYIMTDEELVLNEVGDIDDFAAFLFAYYSHRVAGRIPFDPDIEGEGIDPVKRRPYTLAAISKHAKDAAEIANQLQEHIQGVINQSPDATWLKPYFEALDKPVDKVLWAAGKSLDALQSNDVAVAYVESQNARTFVDELAPVYSDVLIEAINNTGDTMEEMKQYLMLISISEGFFNDDEDNEA